ncbi:MAG: phosphomannomutase/phosphoglucomutase, partial [Methanosarcinales archaeon]|nr:phosphomannomutase/phosphoglucomutase [Methanosarcinales archaeon]
MSIFKAYDVRGLYPSELNEELAYKIGRAFVSYFKIKEVVIGYDARASSSELFKALSDGIIDQGADVVDIGLASTPLLYFASKEAEASIMITASHLPKQYNGFKFCQKQGSPVSKEEIKEIEAIVEREQFYSQKIKVGQIKKIEQSQLMTDFINYNLSFLKGDKKLKIVLDTGNGMSSYTLPRIIEKIDSINLIELYTEIDFSFPNH